MTDHDLIDRLGGATKVAKLIGSNNIQRVQNWKERGIPSKVKLQYPDLFLPNMRAIETTSQLAG
jgi:hypothetical protein